MYHELPDPAERAGWLLWQTAHVFERSLMVALEPFQLTPAQFGAITHVGREPGLSAAELARRLLLTPQSVQTAIRPLTNRALVERRKHPVHGRVLGLFLTDEGRDVAADASVEVAEADSRMLRAFSPEDADDFRAQVRRALLTLNPAALDRSSIRVSKGPSTPHAGRLPDSATPSGGEVDRRAR